MIRQLISIRFSKAAIEKTSNNSTQNKVESCNRVVKKATPSQLTFKRNYHSRVHTAIHGINNNPGTSINKLCRAVGAPITKSSAAYKETQRMDARSQYQKQRKDSHQYTLSRRGSRQERFRIYDKKKISQAGYSKDGCLDDVLYVPSTSTQKKSYIKDHPYSVNRGNSVKVLKKL